MIYLDEHEVARSLTWPKLIAAVELAVAEGLIEAPPRLSYQLQTPATAVPGHLLIMPAWAGDSVIGIKTVTFWRDNAAHSKPSHGASYLLLNARTAEVLAVLDGGELTARRTAAVSIIAAKRLMRPDARRLLVVGTGPIARTLVAAHAATHDFETVEIYGRNPRRAAAAAAGVVALGAGAAHCHASEDLEQSVRQADLIVSATSAESPVIHGEWVSPGTHVDLVGSFTPTMRESDDVLFRRAQAVWVDTRVAIAESGDLVQPLASGALSMHVIQGDLRVLVGSQGRRRERSCDITIFKAVGFAIPDLAAARTAVEQVRAQGRDGQLTATVE